MSLIHPTGDPSVSVIVPVYNKAGTVERALRSISSQTFADIEIIVVNDGSTDASLAQIGGVGDSRIRVISQPNCGEAAARNRGIEAARGRYVAFLDADDRWLANHLELSMQLLRARRELRWCCSAYERRSASGKRLPAATTANLPLREGCYFDDYLAVGGRGGLFCTNGMVIRRSVFGEVGLFDPSLRCGTDQDMWFRIGLVHGRIGYNLRATSVYQLHETSISQQVSGRAGNILTMLGRHRRLAAMYSPAALARMETWTSLWVQEAAKAAIRHNDLAALEDIGSLYGGRLQSPWKQLRRLILCAPGSLAPLAGWGMNAVRRLRTGSVGWRKSA